MLGGTEARPRAWKPARREWAGCMDRGRIRFNPAAPAPLPNAQHIPTRARPIRHRPSVLTARFVPPSRPTTPRDGACVDSFGPGCAERERRRDSPLVAAVLFLLLRNIRRSRIPGRQDRRDRPAALIVALGRPVLRRPAVDPVLR